MREVAVDALPCAVIAYADDGRVVAANRRLGEELGYAPSELPGLRLDRLLPPPARLYYATHLHPTLKLAGRVDEVYLTVRTRSGESLPTLANARRADGPGGPLTILTFLPMHRRAEFEQRLIAARRTAEELLQARSELLDRRDAEARANAALAEQLRALTARLDADHRDATRATARSLHEEVAQDLAALKWQLDALRRGAREAELQAQLAGLEQLAAQTLAQVRELSYDLYPAVLEHADLHGAMRSAARACEQEFGLPVEVTQRRPSPTLARDVLLVLYRFVEEALRRAVRRGGASRATVSVDGTAQDLELAVTDDGTGDVAAAIASGGDLGLLAARERLARYGGSLSATSHRPRGSTLLARIPRAAACGDARSVG